MLKNHEAQEDVSQRSTRPLIRAAAPYASAIAAVPAGGQWKKPRGRSQAGYASRMMLEMSPDRSFGVLSPAFRGCEMAFAANEYAARGCTFFKDERCELYGTGVEPLECRFCHHDRPGLGPRCHADIEKDWNTAGRTRTGRTLEQPHRFLGPSEEHLDPQTMNNMHEPRLSGTLVAVILRHYDLHKMAYLLRQRGALWLRKCAMSKPSILDLSGQQLVAAPNSVGDLASYDGLDLDRNLLTALPENIGSQIHLKTLSLYHNQLASLPDALCRLRNLQLLNVSQNELDRLPDDIGELQSCACWMPPITASPRSRIRLGGLKQLRFLYLSNNLLTGLPASFAGSEELCSI